ncbi:MAG: anti-sigma F factor antagonist [Eubacteriaceae bacterium]
MEVYTNIKEESLIVKIVGELDHHTSEDIRKQLDFLISKNNVKNIVFDLSSLTFLDSSGVGMFMGRYKKIKEKNGMALMTNIKDSNRRLISMSGLFNIYEEYNNPEEALKLLRRGKNEQ